MLFNLLFLLILTVFAIYSTFALTQRMANLLKTRRAETIVTLILLWIMIVMFWAILPIRTETVVLYKNSKIMTLQINTLETYSISGKDTILITSIPKSNTVCVESKPDSIKITKEIEYTVFGRQIEKKIKN